jgi:hypothetical protein
MNQMAVPRKKIEWGQTMAVPVMDLVAMTMTMRGADDDTDEQNCWGKVTSNAAREFEPSVFGQHAANPTSDADNETPREGVGNQDENHPSDHADAVGPSFDSSDGEDDVQCDND